MKPAAASKTRSIVFIAGETPLVEEYAEVCAGKGYEVFVQWNSPGKRTPSKAYRQTSVIPAGTTLALELTNTDPAAKRQNIERMGKALGPTTAMLSSSITVTATEQATWINARHRLVGISSLPGFSAKPLVEVAPTVFTPPETLQVCRTFFHSIGMEIELVQDRVGMVVPRILCQILNEAAFALQEDVTSPVDLDTAMKFGVNYPLGPIEWAEKIGFTQVYAVLAALEQDLKEDRYRVAPLLKQMAQTGEWWKTSSL